MNRVSPIVIISLFLLSCGDGSKSQSAATDQSTDFEIVGKKEKEPEKTDDEPVSVSSILSGNSKATAKDGDVGDVVSGGGDDDPFGGDVDYLDGTDSGYDY